jgi:hypothetical protein
LRLITHKAGVITHSRLLRPAAVWNRCARTQLVLERTLILRSFNLCQIIQTCVHQIGFGFIGRQRLEVRV